MKKNFMMRAACLMLVAAMLTTCSMFGTFAKYTTSDSGSDSARVAKWGMTTVISGSLFGADYAEGSSASTPAGGEISVSYTGSADSSTDATGDNIVAPGTRNSTGMTVKINGQPEVSFALSAGNNGIAPQDIFLGPGYWGVMVPAAGITADNWAADTYYTQSGTSYTLQMAFDPSVTQYFKLQDAITLSGLYYPIRWTLDGSITGGANIYTIAQLKYLAGYETVSLDRNLTVIGVAVPLIFNQLKTIYGDPFPSNKNIDGTFSLTWEWPYQQSEYTYGDMTLTAAQCDTCDTILGDLMAETADGVVVWKSSPTGSYSSSITEWDGVSAISNARWSKDVAFGLTVTVTQVD